MSWNELVYGLGDAVFASFDFLKMGNNYVNWFFIVVTFAVLVGWVNMQAKYNAEAKRTGGFK